MEYIVLGVLSTIYIVWLVWVTIILKRNRKLNQLLLDSILQLIKILQGEIKDE